MSEKKSYENIISTYEKLEHQLSNNIDTAKIAELSKKFSDMTPLVEKIKKYEKFNKELLDLEDLCSSEELDLKNMALLDKGDLKEKIINIETEIKILLIPKDTADQKMRLLKLEQALAEMRQLYSPRIFLGCI